MVLKISVFPALSSIARSAATTGNLTAIEYSASAGAGGGHDPALNSLRGARCPATSPDGNNVYVAGFSRDSITNSDRGAATGQLTEAGSIADAEANRCTNPIPDGHQWIRHGPTTKSCLPINAPGGVK
jgi:hypothetical protein